MIDWQKVDLSEGFWRMIVEHGEAYNFVFQLPERPGDTTKYYVIPGALQMGLRATPVPSSHIFVPSAHAKAI